MTDPRIVQCSACDGEGRLYEADCDWQHGPGERDIGPCDQCEGTGGEIIDTQPIELEDLDQ